MSGVRVAAGVELGAATHAGRVRTENEDDYLVLSQPESGVLLVAIADGMGGLAGGADASRAAVRALGAICAERGASADGEGTLRDGFAAAAARLKRIASGNARLAELGTTLTALLLRGDSVFVGHVGDTRCLRVRRGAVEALTIDHALEEPRHLLTRCLGAGQDGADGDFSRVECKSGDTFVLCTDGAWSLLEASEIAAEFRSGPLQAACERLAQTALDRGAPDNVTIVAVRVEPQPDAAPREIEIPTTEFRTRRRATGGATSLGAARWPYFLFACALALAGLAWARWQHGFDLLAAARRWLD